MSRYYRQFTVIIIALVSVVLAITHTPHARALAPSSLQNEKESSSDLDRLETYNRKTNKAGYSVSSILREYEPSAQSFPVNKNKPLKVKVGLILNDLSGVDMLTGNK